MRLPSYCMKKTVLSNSDLADIQQHALSIWKDKSGAKDDYFNVRCIVQSFIDYTVKRGIVVKDGEVYEKETEKPT